MAVGAAEYILQDLYWTDGAKVGFSYPMPGLRGETHNANLLAAALFCRLYRETGEKKFRARVTSRAPGGREATAGWFVVLRRATLTALDR